MALDFPRNLKHIVGYEECKNFVYKHLVKNTTCKITWDEHLREACRKWPSAAEYLQSLSRSKERWGAPWRMECFTLGMEASSAVEGSFSGFQRYVGEPQSFVGVVQQHIQKDNDKISEERRSRVKAEVSRHDDQLISQRTKSANECATVCSNKVVEQFIVTNLQAQEYEFHENENLKDEQLLRGVEKAYTLYLKGIDKMMQPERIVEKIAGIYHCKWCMQDLNGGVPCKHIQRVCDFDFIPEQFHDHWKLENTDVTWLPAVDHTQHENESLPDTASPAAAPEDFFSAVDSEVDHTKQEGEVMVGNDGSTAQAGGDGIGEFVRDYARKPLQIEPKRFSGLKRKRSSQQRHNDLLDKGKIIAANGSADEDTYHKLMAVLGYIQANLQNKGAEEMKEAVASYLDLSTSLSGDADILDIEQSTKKRGVGGSCTNRKKSAVESQVSKQKGKRKCGLCHQLGHTKANCGLANRFGQRLVAKTWPLLRQAQILNESKDATDIDTIVPTDAIALQILGKVETQIGDVYKANVILNGLTVKEGSHLYIHDYIVERWAAGGTSGSHSVFIHRLQE